MKSLLPASALLFFLGVLGPAPTTAAELPSVGVLPADDDAGVGSEVLGRLWVNTYAALAASGRFSVADPEKVQQGYGDLTVEEREAGADAAAGKALELDWIVRPTVESSRLGPTGVTVKVLRAEADQHRNVMVIRWDFIDVTTGEVARTTTVTGKKAGTYLEKPPAEKIRVHWTAFVPTRVVDIAESYGAQWRPDDEVEEKWAPTDPRVLYAGLTALSMENAVDRAEEKFLRLFPIRGEVVEIVDKKTVRISVGSKLGVRAKTKFEVFAAEGDTKPAGVLKIKEAGEGDALATSSPLVIKKIAAGDLVQSKD